MSVVTAWCTPGMYSCDEEEIDELRSWDEVALHLADEWVEVRDRTSGLRVVRDDRSVLVREPTTATAKQRRLLHRSGCRLWAERCWSWTPPDPDAAELKPPPFPSTLPRLRERWAAMQVRAARDRALAAMALRVVRDLMSCAAEDLTVVVLVEREDWDEVG